MRKTSKKGLTALIATILVAGSILIGTTAEAGPPPGHNTPACDQVPEQARVPFCLDATTTSTTTTTTTPPSTSIPQR